MGLGWRDRKSGGESEGWEKGMGADRRERGESVGGNGRQRGESERMRRLDAECVGWIAKCREGIKAGQLTKCEKEGGE